MTIKPNEEWGVEVDRPDGLLVVDGDAALARAVGADRTAPVAVAGGDLHRTIGARPIGDRATLRALPLDVLEVELDGSPAVVAVSHVVVRTPTSRGGWLRGPVTLVMNAEFLGDWDVAPRGHPNDGRAERFDLDPSVGVRQRLAIRRRLPAATHLPHPGITRRVGAEHVIERSRPSWVVADGTPLGPARRIRVRVLADAVTLLA